MPQIVICLAYYLLFSPTYFIIKKRQKLFLLQTKLDIGMYYVQWNKLHKYRKHIVEAIFILSMESSYINVK